MTNENDNTRVNLTHRETSNPIATLLLMLEEALGRASDTPANQETKKQLSVITENAIWSINNWTESVSTMLGDRLNGVDENKISPDELSLVVDSVNLLRQLSVINDALNDLRGLSAITD